MSKLPFQTAATAILITLAGGPFGLGEVHAKAIYTGTFDPEGPQYIWSGTHQFSVDNACLTTDGWKAVNGNAFYDAGYAIEYNSCGGVELLGGTLTLKDKLAVSGVPEQTALFSAEFTLPLTAGIWGIYVKGGQLAGVDTNLIGDIRFDEAPLNVGYWAMRWESGWAPAAAYANVPVSGLYVPNPVDPVYLYQCSNSPTADCTPATPEPARVVTFHAVPEPFSLGLVGMACLAAAVTRRRRRA